MPSPLPPWTDAPLPTAVVLNANFPALAIVRSLARGRVPVRMVEEPGFFPHLFTRYARAERVPQLTGPELVDPLLELGESVRRETGLKPVLIPTQDDTVMDLLPRREEVLERFHCSLDAPEVLAQLLTKTGCEAAARAHDIPQPETLTVRGEADLPALNGLYYPCLIKPNLRDKAYSQAFYKTVRATSAEQARDTCRQMLAFTDAVVVQEWIEGGDDSIVFDLLYISVHSGEVLASFTGRKLHTWRPGIGDTYCAVPAPEVDPVIGTRTRRFLPATGVRGWCSVEYKYDANRHDYVVMEPTVGRMNAQLETATLNGVNLPLVGYCDLAGLPQPTIPAPPEAWAWRRDAWVTRRAARLKGLPASPPGMPYRDGTWRWDDPLPGVFSYGGRLLGKAGRLLRRDGPSD